jgi:CRP-like cAMP-binding protein
MADQPIALHILALIAEARWRGDRLAASLGRLDAHARICLMLLDIYERLRRRELINRPNFNLPFTQEQIADHLGLTLVHVNRTLRRLREERLVLVDRQVVIIKDLDRLRALVRSSCPSVDLPEPAAPVEAVANGAPISPFAP